MIPKALSREIKFRMLETRDDETRWEYFTLPYDLGIDNEIYLNSENYKQETLSQFTGLYDKNRKEIYEGDIVADRSNTDLIFAIEYDTEHVGYYMPEEFEEECRWPISEVELEIIGNIYENPELLTKENE